MIPQLSPEIVEMIRRMLAAGFSVERIGAITAPCGPTPFQTAIVATAQELANKKAAPGTPEPGTASI